MKFTRTASKLNTSVLVLNRYYLAVHVVAARRAFILLYRDLAEVIHVEDGQYGNYDFESWCEMSDLLAQQRPAAKLDRTPRKMSDEIRHGDLSPQGARQLEHLHDDDDDWIRSVNFHLRIPRVVRLLTYDRAPRQTLRFNRRNLFARDEHRCQYCDQKLQIHQLSLDHVIPRSRGGQSTWENVVSSCVDCNTRKGSRTPVEARMRLRRPPVKPNFNPLLRIKLANPKYEIWRAFLPHAHRDEAAASRK